MKLQEGQVVCVKCGGLGVVEDPRFVGSHLRSLREKSDLSLRRMAEILGITPPYLSDLERGNRAFSQGLKQSYLNALNTKQETKA